VVTDGHSGKANENQAVSPLAPAGSKYSGRNCRVWWGTWSLAPHPLPVGEVMQPLGKNSYFCSKEKTD
jgi:hypothetical protein